MLQLKKIEFFVENKILIVVYCHIDMIIMFFLQCAGTVTSSLDFNLKDMDENSFDVIIFGTGLVESIVAACVLNWLHNWLL